MTLGFVCLALWLAAGEVSAIEPVTSRLRAVPPNHSTALLVVREGNDATLQGVLRESVSIGKVWPLQTLSSDWQSVGLQPRARPNEPRPQLMAALREAKGKSSADEVALVRTVLEAIKRQPIDRAETRRQDLFVAELELAKALLRHAPDEPELRRLLVDLAVRQNGAELSAREDLVKRYDAVREALRTAPPAHLRLRGVPERVLLSIDGQTPMRVPPDLVLWPGEHELSVVSVDGDRWRVGLWHVVTVKAGETLTLDLDLEVEWGLRLDDDGAWWAAAADVRALSVWAQRERLANVAWALTRPQPQRLDLEASDGKSVTSGRLEWNDTRDVHGLGRVIYALGSTVTQQEVSDAAKILPEWTERLEAGVWVMTPGARFDETPVYRKWWFWTAIGGAAVAIAGGSTAAYLLTRPSDRRDAVFSIHTQ